MTNPNDNSPRRRIEANRTPRWVNVSDIYIHPEAQRRFRPMWASKIAAEFDPDAFLPPRLSFRDGKYWCIDGQHTVAAFRLMGWEDQQVQCLVYEGLTEQKEADLFLMFANTKAIPAFEYFRIAVFAERPEETDINRIVLAHGLKVSTDDGGIGAVAALREVYGYSPKTLSRMITIVDGSFGEVGFSSNIMRGVGLVCARYNGELVDDHAIAKMSTIRGGVTGLTSKAAVAKRTYGKPMAQCVAATVIDTYNAGRGGKKLPDWWKS